MEEPPKKKFRNFLSRPITIQSKDNVMVEYIPEAVSMELQLPAASDHLQADSSTDLSVRLLGVDVLVNQDITSFSENDVLFVPPEVGMALKGMKTNAQIYYPDSSKESVIIDRTGNLVAYKHIVAIPTRPMWYVDPPRPVTAFAIYSPTYIQPRSTFTEVLAAWRIDETGKKTAMFIQAITTSTKNSKTWDHCEDPKKYAWWSSDLQDHFSKKGKPIKEVITAFLDWLKHDYSVVICDSTQEMMWLYYNIILSTNTYPGQVIQVRTTDHVEESKRKYFHFTYSQHPLERARNLAHSYQQYMKNK
jgi:hypothetical protein